MIVTLKDGSKKEYAEAKSVIDIAYDISEGLARAACAGEVNGEVVDLRTVIDSDCELNILTAKDEKGLAVLRHTASHVLAQAVQTLFPDAKVAIGPSIDTGFYYDFDCPPFSRDDLDAIEKEMKKIIKKGAKIERFTKSREDAIAYFQEKNEPYKVELIEDLPEGSEISFYSQGDWTDLCAGPHLMSVKGVKAFKLLSSSSAYWRGSEKNKMLSRIYATAFPKASELEAYLNMIEEAKKRDHRKLGKEEVSEYCHRFMAFQFRHGPFSMTNFKASDEYLRTGDRIIRSYPLVDIDEINLPSMVKPYTQMNINGYGIATDLLSFLTGVPYSDCVVFNQVIQIPGQRKLLRKLQAKAKRHGSMPDPSNRIAKADIEEVLDRLAVDSTMLVYCNFNILVSCPPDKVTPVTSFLETKLYECGIMPSRTAYNQLELFMDCFPGNGYAFNPDYDLFLTLSDAALCFFFKEHLKESEDTPLTTYYTDRQGLPVCIDITGKEGKKKMTDNANFFCIGPSGSGKSFHMNSVVRQLLEQNTDVVMVDTGDSYEGICGYYKGTYIALSLIHI